MSSKQCAPKSFAGTARGTFLPAVLVTVALLLPLLLAWLPGGTADLVEGDTPASIDWTAFMPSLAVALAAAALAVLIGSVLGGIFVLTDLPGRNLWATAALVPFVCPPMVWALGHVYCYGSGGLAERWSGDAWRTLLGLSDPKHYLATALVMAEIYAPLAMLIVGRGLGRLQHAGHDAARLFLSQAARIRWIAGAVRLELLAAFLLVLPLCLGTFAVPHVLQCPLYPIEIYLRISNYLDHAGALWISLPLLVVTMVTAAGVAAAERSTRYASTAPSAPRTPIPLGRRVWIVGSLLALYLGLTTLLPLAAIVYECKSAAHFFEAVRLAAPETEHTVWIGLAAAVAACFAGLLVGAWVARCKQPALDAVALAPIGVPAIILGLAYARFFNRDWPIDLSPLDTTSVLVVLALAARGWPFVTRVVSAGHRRVASEWRETAELAELTGPARWRWITGPLIADHAAAGSIVAFTLAVGDVEISQMLCAPGYGTLSMRLFAFLHFGPAHTAASLALLLLILAMVPVIVYFLFTNRCLQIV